MTPLNITSPTPSPTPGEHAETTNMVLVLVFFLSIFVGMCCCARVVTSRRFIKCVNEVLTISGSSYIIVEHNDMSAAQGNTTLRTHELLHVALFLYTQQEQVPLQAITQSIHAHSHALTIQNLFQLLLRHLLPLEQAVVAITRLLLS